MPQFHVIFDDYFETITTNFSSLPADSVNDLFDHLWNTSQWVYDGNIPPKYLFPETSDLSDNDINNDQDISNNQLATDLLDDETLNFYISGEPPPLLNHQQQIANLAESDLTSDQLNTSDVAASSPDQLHPSGPNQMPLDQPNTSGAADLGQGQLTPPQAHTTSLTQPHTSGQMTPDTINTNSINKITQSQSSLPP